MERRQVLRKKRLYELLSEAVEEPLEAPQQPVAHPQHVELEAPDACQAAERERQMLRELRELVDKRVQVQHPCLQLVVPAAQPLLQPKPRADLAWLAVVTVQFAQLERALVADVRVVLSAPLVVAQLRVHAVAWHARERHVAVELPTRAAFLARTHPRLDGPRVARSFLHDRLPVQTEPIEQVVGQQLVAEPRASPEKRADLVALHPR